MPDFLQVRPPAPKIPHSVQPLFNALLFSAGRPGGQHSSPPLAKAMDCGKRKLGIYKVDGNSWLKIKNRTYSQAEGRHELLTRGR